MEEYKSWTIIDAVISLSPVALSAPAAPSTPAALSTKDKPSEDTPPAVLDLGCGEGWLCRELAQRGMRVTGADAVPALIEQARQLNENYVTPIEYTVLSYEQVAEGKLASTYDVVICNFSLLGQKSVEQLFSMIHTLLNPGGVFIIQTLHPHSLKINDSMSDSWKQASQPKDSQQKDSWQRETWKTFDEPFATPSPWFFRTREQWSLLFQSSKLTMLDVIEPRHPNTDQLMSLILAGRCQR